MIDEGTIIVIIAGIAGLVIVIGMTLDAITKLWGCA